ncbi:MAG: M28 family peptidase [Paludibacteraceae bacterium]|nr:M28 family peptidase [Paludibacteraceae bacterium]
MRRHYSLYIIPLVLVMLVVCNSSCTNNKPKKSYTPPSVSFSADSAYRYIAEQVAFGARVPGTAAHRRCYEYLSARLYDCGARVEIQQGEMTNYAGEKQPIVNIIAHYGRPTANRKRLLLCAHWDCRPWADQEENYYERQTPVTGANDGASGVGVLLEIARQLGERQAAIASNGNNGEMPLVDIVFFDCEDMGTPDFYTGKELENTWCLGSQLWAERVKNGKTGDGVMPADYSFGILLDMVGAPGATFPKEYISMQHAANRVNQVWNKASELGYGKYFVEQVCYPITDDHFYVNTIAGIPCIDIIHYETGSATGFAPYWHTTRDDMRNIDPATLDAVGKTIMTIIN